MPITIEGYTPEEILRLTEPELDTYLFTGGPVVLRAGSAEVLGEFRRGPDALEVELAQIEGGGEGVLLALWTLTAALARQLGCGRVEWTVHAVHCARPNLKLRAVLERRGFTRRALPGGGEAYCYTQEAGSPIQKPETPPPVSRSHPGSTAREKRRIP